MHPEGFIFERLEKDKFVAHIFVDSDWESELPNSEITWGKEFQNRVRFGFEEVDNGFIMIL